jgi:hypothetical protein
MSAPKGELLLRTAAATAKLFGLLTVVSGGSMLFGSEAAQRTAGAYVDFVLWFNFVAGFFYVIAGIGLWLRRPWAVVLALAVAVTTLITFAAFGVHVLQGRVRRAHLGRDEPALCGLAGDLVAGLRESLEPKSGTRYGWNR